MNRNLFSMAALLISALNLHAEVRLPKLLGNHMVLQRQQPIHLWGWAEPGEKVTASMNDKTQSTMTDAVGHWNVYLPAMSAGGPFELRINGSTLEDVMVGDVWFASGQSNMEMPLKGFPGNAVIKNSDEEIRNAGHKELRLFRTPKRASDYPLPDFDAQWTECTPETAADFSAVAYFFGRQIAKDEHVAIGLIDSTWGGTPAEAWVSLEGLSADSSLMPAFAAFVPMEKDQAEMDAMLKAEKREADEAKAAGKPAPNHPWHPAPESWAPAGLFNGMVSAALKFHIKGVIWYQGESNASALRANMYQRIFPALIQDWRTQWREGDFPFLFVQLSNFSASPNESYQTIREAQRRTLSVAKTGMAVTVDIGLPENVHPSNKQDVGARLALAAEAIAYGKQLEWAGPMFRETSIEDSSLRVWFDHTTGGLKGTNGFEIAGADHRFVPANAQVDGDTVVLTAGDVASPAYARYGWANAPTVNLVNGAGLPASPFTSEEHIPAFTGH